MMQDPVPRRPAPDNSLPVGADSLPAGHGMGQTVAWHAEQRPHVRLNLALLLMCDLLVCPNIPCACCRRTGSARAHVLDAGVDGTDVQVPGGAAARGPPAAGGPRAARA